MMMKTRVLLLILVVFCASTMSIFCQDSDTKRLTFSVTTDFAYYPLSAYVPTGNHFAPLTGPYSGLEARITGNANYTIPTPFGTNPLVSGNTLVLNPALEVSPVSLTPMFSVSFTPIAFLVFSVGGKIGAGWDFIGINGLAGLNEKTGEYESIEPFSSYHYLLWGRGLFQFDLAAVVPGEWNHAVIMATYEVDYEGITSGGDNKKVWMWQGIGEKVNGLQYYSSVILGYQMPLVLQTVGVQSEFYGFYNQSDFADKYADWNPTFMTVSINPLAILKFNSHNSLIVQAGFSSRRSFDKAYDDDVFIMDREYSGREWFFRRIALSYTYSF